MATDAEQVAALKTALATGAGVVSVTIDGQTVRYDRDQALRELQFYESRAARASTRPLSQQINMGGAW